jgi:hypothetical protein
MDVMPIGLHRDLQANKAQAALDTLRLRCHPVSMARGKNMLLPHSLAAFHGCNRLADHAQASTILVYAIPSPKINWQNARFDIYPADIYPLPGF